MSDCRSTKKDSRCEYLIVAIRKGFRGTKHSSQGYKGTFATRTCNCRGTKRLSRREHRFVGLQNVLICYFVVSYCLEKKHIRTIERFYYQTIKKQTFEHFLQKLSKKYLLFGKKQTDNDALERRNSNSSQFSSRKKEKQNIFHAIFAFLNSSCFVTNHR